MINVKDLTEEQKLQFGLLDFASSSNASKANKTTNRKSTGTKSSQEKEETKVALVSLKFDYRFSILICDEAHTIKNEKSSFHKMVGCIQRDGLVLCSATPMLNHPKDNLSYLRLAFWNRFPRIEIPKRCDPLSLYEEDFNPYSPIGEGVIVDQHGVMMRTKPSPSILKEEPANEQEQAFRDAYDIDEIRFWILSPSLFRVTARYHHWSFNQCKVMIGAILAQVFLRRTMNTTIELPDGILESPGQELKGAKFTTVEIHLPEALRKRYNYWYEELEPLLYVAEETPSIEDPGSDETAIHINAGIWRRLDILAVNLNDARLLRLHELLERQKESSDELGDLTAPLPLITQPPIEDVPITADTPPPSAIKRAVLASSDGVAVGAKEVDTLIQSCSDGGARYIYEYTVRDQRLPMPQNRISLIKFLTAESPLIAGVILEILELKRQPIKDGLPNRCVLMVDAVWTQQ